MNFHWGYKIALLYGSFAIGMLALVIRSSQEDFNLVTKDYYQQEINYQQRINEQQNSQQLKEKLQISCSKQEVVLKFPKDKKSVNGTVKMYRPADASKDQQVPILMDEAHQQVVNTAGMAKGNWKVQVSWECDGIAYFDEQVIHIN
ncbi:MAG: FixH family protein [Chitinophagales bacterium]|nr:FixH family protein [Chitinophagales bacterium]